MEEILKIANKIIKSKLLKDCEVLFLSYYVGEEIEIFLKPAIKDINFIRYCLLKGIRFGVIIIRYNDIKRFNTIIEETKLFLDYATSHRLEINNFFVLKGGKYRNLTNDFIN